MLKIPQNIHFQCRLMPSAQCRRRSAFTWFPMPSALLMPWPVYVRQAHHANFWSFLKWYSYYILFLLNKFQIHIKKIYSKIALVEKITYNQFVVMIFQIIKVKTTFQFCECLNEANIDIHLNICVLRLYEKILVLGKL